MRKVNLYNLFTYLSDHLGPIEDWPAETKVEIILGAILVQNTNWSNVLLALKELDAKTGLDPQAILALTTEDLQNRIRSAGFYRNKSKAIQEVLTWFSDHHWDYQAISDSYGPDLRKFLLNLHGIGFETADVLLIYVFDQVHFVSDAYARRLIGWLEGQTYPTYQSLHGTVVLPADFTDRQAKVFHGLIVEFGKKYFKGKPPYAPPIDERLKWNLLD